MASLGPQKQQPWAGRYLRPVVSPRVYSQPTLLDPNPLSIDVNGSISGVVKIAGVPTEGVRIGLFHRSNMELIATTISSNTGAYIFRFLDRSDLKNYFVTFLDPATDPAHNYTLTRDHLTAG